jgi:charged multivesicular body protein 6
MLGGKMSNQDEDEVEDELEAMEREVAGVPSLPDAPNTVQEALPDVPQETPEEKAKRRRQERAARQQEAEPIPA